jgi:hypothetical protein
MTSSQVAPVARALVLVLGHLGGQALDSGADRAPILPNVGSTPALVPSAPDRARVDAGARAIEARLVASGATSRRALRVAARLAAGRPPSAPSGDVERTRHVRSEAVFGISTPLSP